MPASDNLPIRVADEYGPAIDVANVCGGHDSALPVLRAALCALAALAPVVAGVRVLRQTVHVETVICPLVEVAFRLPADQRHRVEIEDPHHHDPPLIPCCRVVSLRHVQIGRVPDQAKLDAVRALARTVIGQVIDVDAGQALQRAVHVVCGEDVGVDAHWLIPLVVFGFG